MCLQGSSFHSMMLPKNQTTPWFTKTSLRLSLDPTVSCSSPEAACAGGIVVTEGRASQSVLLALYLVSAVLVRNLLPCAPSMGPGELWGTAGSCSTARGCGSSDPSAQGPPRPPWPCSTAHQCSQCSLQLCMSSAVNLSCWDLPVPFLNLSVDGHFCGANRHLGEEQRRLLGRCWPSKPTPVAKAHCAG